MTPRTTSHRARRSSMWVATALVTALLAACGGGGGDDSGSTGSNNSSGNDTGGTNNSGGNNSGGSTAGLTDNRDTANALATEASKAIAAAQRMQDAPGGVQSLGLVPGGISSTTACPNGGTMSYDIPTTGIAAGTTMTYAYSNCSYATGWVFDGTYQWRYDSYASFTDFAYTLVYNLHYTGPGYDYTYNGTRTCRHNAGDVSCTYNDGERSFDTGFRYSGGTINGSYTWTASSYGSVSMSFSNWSATSGTATISGPSGTSATITRTGANTYSVVINGGTAWAVAL